MFCAVSAVRGICGGVNINFSEASASAYYDASSSSLTWDSTRSYLYLPLGTQKNVFSTKYPNLSPVNPPNLTAQMGCSLVVQDDCYISGVARWAGANGGNPIVRMWTNDTEEYAGGITYPWVDMGVGNYQGWVERSVDFSLSLYPLTAGNTYWLANVADGIPAHQVGDAGAATSGCDYVSVAVVGGQPQRWYIKNDETPPGSDSSPSENLEFAGAPNLYGVPDLRLNRFNAAGALISKKIDLGATKVAVSDFQATFQTSNAKIGFEAGGPVTKSGAMAYDITYNYISKLRRAPKCSAVFSIAQSSDGDNFGAFQTAFAGVIDKRYIKIRMELTTEHRGITPIVDSVNISYNCYPEAIEASSVSPAEGALVTASSPVFRWSPAEDNDGDMVTYTLSLSDTASFDDLVFSTTAVSVPSSTYVAVNCPVELDDKTTYFFRIDAEDSNGAFTGYEQTFSFKTELMPLYLADSDIINGSRVITSYVQNGFVLQFSKDINFGTFSGAFTFIDASSSPVVCTFSAPTPSSVRVLPSDTIEPCKSYYFSVGLSLKDTVGLGIREEASVYFGTLNSKTAAYTTTVAGSSITISAGGSPEDFFVIPANLAISPTENTDLLTANNLANSTAFVIALSSEAFSYSITNSAGAEIISLTGLTVKLPYEPVSLSVSLSAVALSAGRRALSDNITVPPELLRVFKLNENSSQWGLVPGNQAVDTVSKTVTAYPASGGTFSLLAYPSNPAANVQLRNTPNPFYRGSLTAITYYLSAAVSVKAKIYTQIGHLIYEQEYAAGAPGGQAAVNSITWDGKNKSGAYVASGIYLLRLEIAGEDARTRKIGFIR
ncbi:MAG: hypothetical protein CVU78_05600 [Elusimicrobia bacterium HGW-Elusimicrobia-2]|nr:MAG: hypothetical protein CVU78_05600 [Elusimicrobia bacterium HGW-Elusimicrobia-2]